MLQTKEEEMETKGVNSPIIFTSSNKNKKMKEKVEMLDRVKLREEGETIAEGYIQSFEGREWANVYIEKVFPECETEEIRNSQGQLRTWRIASLEKM